MQKKKALLKKVKQQLQDRRKESIKNLSSLYKKRDTAEDKSELNDQIDRLISEIKLIDDDLARKDKKSSRVTWVDEDYSPAPRAKGSNAEIVDHEEYESARESVATRRAGPVALWLKPGILVKTKGRDLPGIVVEVFGSYASVLFGGSTTNVRSLALRPADLED